MRPPKLNAFLRTGAVPGGASRRNLASLLAPMRAAVTETNLGWALEVEPLFTADALRFWRRHHEASRPESLTKASRVLVVEDAGAASGLTLAAAATRLAIPVAEQFGGDLLVLALGDLLDLMTLTRCRGLTVTVIDGPIEERDARAVGRVVAGGGSPLAGDLRAVLGLRPLGERALHVEGRQRTDLAAIVAGNLRHYLAAITGRPISDLTEPEPALVDHLLERTGRLTVRPIETEIYSTWIDVGVNTSGSHDARPADTSIIYDLYGRSWHGE